MKKTEPTYGEIRIPPRHIASKSYGYAFLAGCLVMALPFVFQGLLFGGLAKKIPQPEELKSGEVDFAASPFDGVELEARAAYVYDMTTGRALYAKNETEQLPLASLTKIMTALVANDLIPQSAVITLSRDDIAEEGDSGLLVGERWGFRSITDFMLTASSNDGASALASVGGILLEGDATTTTSNARAAKKKNFIDRMNAKTRDLRLRNTFFLNETGLDIDEYTSGGYGTAEDVSVLLAYAVKHAYPVVQATALDRLLVSSLDDVPHSIRNTNSITGEIPALIASKTGFTELAGGNLSVAFDAGIMRPIVVTVLGSTKDGRFEDVRKLVWATLKKISQE